MVWPSSMMVIFAVACTLSKGQKTVNRAGEGLTAVPTYIDPGVKTLILRNNRIARIEDEDMANLLLLERLSLDSNGVNFISKRAFANNSFLIMLRFMGHRLSIFPTEFGGAWQSLVEVVGSVGLNDMQPAQLTHLPALKVLKMSTNQAHNLSIGHLPEMKELRTHHCRLEIFPYLAGAPNLELVTLSHNSFSYIPASAVSGLVKLRKLQVTDCGLRYLSDLPHLVSLKELHITQNALTSLPDLYHLPLTRVTWHDNPIMCNKALCWVRKWNSMKPGITDLENVVCAVPQGLSLMDVHPVDMKCYDGKYSVLLSLQWGHNGLDSASNHQLHDCLLNRLFRRRSKKTSKLRVAGLCAGNSPGTGEFPAQMASNAENVSIWWRHHL